MQQIVTNSSTNCADTLMKTIQIHETPSVSFNAMPNTQCEGEVVDFNNTGSSDSSKWSYEWDFGSGASPTTSTAENPQGVTYSTAGTKDVTFTIYNDNGKCSNSTTGNVTINETPKADFFHTKDNCTNDTVEFTYNGSTSSDLSTDWDFGSGASLDSSDQMNPPDVNYSTSGIKEVKLIVADTVDGCSDTAMKTFNIDQAPTLNFNSNAPECAGDVVDFTNNGTTDTSWSYSWDFGAGAFPQTYSSVQPGDVSYSFGGDKIVRLNISNENCSASDTIMIGIDSLPKANAGEDTTICANSSVQIGDSALANHTYQWFPTATLDDASSSAPISSPIATITNYVVTVTNNNTGCSNEDSVTVTMLNSGMVEAGEDVEICKGDTVQIGRGPLEGQ
ncbi:MAG: PKD domain-containing protein, partial [Flavobacteriales bacterium]